MLMTAKNLLVAIHKKYPTAHKHNLTINNSGQLVLSVWIRELSQPIVFNDDDEVKPLGYLLYELGQVIK